MRLPLFTLTLILCARIAFGSPVDTSSLPPAAERTVDYVEDIRPIFQEACYPCHSEQKRKGDFRLDLKAAALKGGGRGPAILPGKGTESPLIHYVAGLIHDMVMPAKGEHLTPEQIALLLAWIDQGADWPDGADDAPDPLDFWSLRPLHRPNLPSGSTLTKTRNPIDAFVTAKLREKGLAPSPPADRRTLIRRLYFDLTGLAPSPEEVERFVANDAPDAYQRLVDRLLASTRYGERWARHWLDVVHYGDTHGYDKDKPRPNAWPYRDYVIRAFNEDRPYSRFVKEQLAGDVLYPDTVDGLAATGFISAGPWDFIGHAEVPESKIDGKIARNLDRDDMVSNTMNTFLSLTVQCARCHNHKFDPVSQEDYYSLQAVFAALDRADRPYDPDPKAARQRRLLTSQQQRLLAQQKELQEQTLRRGGEELAALNQAIQELQQTAKTDGAAFGYHSQIATNPDQTKWVQVDLGASINIHRIAYVGCNDDFNGIGQGFGFPVRFKIEASDDSTFLTNVALVVDHTSRDFPNPGTTPQFVEPKALSARYLRVTANKLAARSNDYILALAELIVLDGAGNNVARTATVTALDSIEAPVRWQKSNLVDGYYFGVSEDPNQLARLANIKERRAALLDRVMDQTARTRGEEIDASLTDIEEKLRKLPPQAMVYAGTVHKGSGAFSGTGGTPRTIHVLRRGDVQTPGPLSHPGTVPIIHGVPGRFKLAEDASEGQRRVQLAEWIARPDNPLTWRSIVNRVWHYHFGTGIVDSPNDFGRMGARPTHPELLDWLAVEFRDGGQSIKQLHRLILLSDTYRQSAAVHPENALKDGGNQFLWRMNRRRLSAEEIRDTALHLAGKLDQTMYGPGFQDFVIEKPEHSPHYQYHLHDPEDVRTHRRSIYRFLVRSQQSPFMTTLDCADPSQLVAKRNETLTPLQALALMNNRFMLSMAGHFAGRLAKAGATTKEQIQQAFSAALSRPATPGELEDLAAFAAEHGLPHTCRLILNLNEFVFVD